MLPSQRHLFELPDDVTYLNCAYLSPLPRRVEAAGAAGMAGKRRPWAVGPDDFFDASERARAGFAALLGASPGDVALTPAVSYGIGVAAANLPLGAGGRVLVLDEQFPSNVYPWREKARACGGEVIAAPRGPGGWTPEVLARLDERVQIVALPHCHWTDGSRVDLAAVGARCREVGAALVVDATQSLGAMPLDLEAVQPDFLACAGYKWLFGPYGLGFLYAHPRHHGGRPIEHNWINRADSEQFSGLVRYRDGFQPGARRYDVGERSQFVLAPMLAEAVAMVGEWGIDRIAATLGALTDAIAARAEAAGLRVGADRSPHMIGLRFPGGVPAGLPERLRAERVYVSVRGDAVRVAPHLYNDLRDVERLFEVLSAAP